MLSHSPEILGFWVPLVVLSLIGIGVLAYEMRRVGYTVKDLAIAVPVAVGGAVLLVAALVAVFAAVEGLAHLGEMANARFGGIPAYDVARRIAGWGFRALALLFWVLTLVVASIYGVYGLIAPFGLLGWRRVARWHFSTVSPFRRLSSSFWNFASITADPEMLKRLAQMESRRVRIILWLRHEVSAMLLLAISCVALLELVGKVSDAWPVLAPAVAAAWVVNPSETEAARLELTYENGPVEDMGDDDTGPSLFSPFSS